MIDYQFRGCWVNVDDRAQWLQTVFPNGAKLPARPEPGPGYAALADRLGYRGDLWRCCWEHEVFHTIACELSGAAHSPTLFTAACQLSGIVPVAPFPVNDAAYEERLILDLQAFFNGVERPSPDVVALSRVAGVRPNRLKYQFDSRLEGARR